MKTLNHYYVEIGDSTGIIQSRNQFSCTKIPVLAENDNYLVLNNDCFTVLSHQKSYLHTQLDKPSIHVYTGDSCFGNRITYHLYTETNKRAATIRKQIEDHVKAKYGFLGRLDLSLITDDSLEEAA